MDHYEKHFHEICVGISRLSSAEEKLEYAFEMWAVRIFELLINSPEAKDLIETCNANSKEIYRSIGLQFEAQLSDILRPLIKPNSKLSSEEFAVLLRHGVRGFKEAAQDFDMSAAELRKMIKDFLKVVFKSLE